MLNNFQKGWLKKIKNKHTIGRILKYWTPSLGQPIDIPTTKSYQYECKTRGTPCVLTHNCQIHGIFKNEAIERLSFE
jgi:hypothetical protein